MTDAGSSASLSRVNAWKGEAERVTDSFDSTKLDHDTDDTDQILSFVEPKNDVDTATSLDDCKIEPCILCIFSTGPVPPKKRDSRAVQCTFQADE